MTYLPSGRIHPVSENKERRAGVRTWNTPGDFLRGALNGIAAGTFFILAQSLINIALGRPADFYLRMVASFALGYTALVPAYDPFFLPLIALLIQAVTKGAAGIVFLLLCRALIRTGFTFSRGGYVALGAAFGCAYWLFAYGLAGSAFTQTALLDRLWNGFVAHTLFFGAMLGILTSIPGGWTVCGRAGTMKEEYHGTDSGADR